MILFLEKKVEYIIYASITHSIVWILGVLGSGIIGYLILIFSPQGEQF